MDDLTTIDISADELASLTSQGIAYSAPIATPNYWLTPAHDLAMTNAASQHHVSHGHGSVYPQPQQQQLQYHIVEKIVTPAPHHAVGSHLLTPVQPTMSHGHGGGHMGGVSNDVATNASGYAFALPYDPFGDMFDVDTTGLGSPDPFSPESTADSPYTIDDDNTSGGSSSPLPLPSSSSGVLNGHDHHLSATASMAALLAAASSAAPSIPAGSIPASSPPPNHPFVAPLPPLPPAPGTSSSAPLPNGGRTRPKSNSNSSTSSASSSSSETKRVVPPPPTASAVTSSSSSSKPTKSAAKKDAKGKKVPRKKAPKCKCLGWNPECLEYAEAVGEGEKKKNFCDNCIGRGGFSGFFVDVTSLREIKEEDAYRHIKYPFHLPPKERAGLSIKPAFIRTCHLSGGRRCVVYTDAAEANEADRKYPLLKKYNGFKGTGFSNTREQFYYCPSCKQVQVVFTERPDGGKYKSKNGCCAAKMAARKKKDQKIQYDPNAPLPIDTSPPAAQSSRHSANLAASSSSSSSSSSYNVPVKTSGGRRDSNSATAAAAAAAATAFAAVLAAQQAQVKQEPLSPPSSPGNESISSQSSADIPPPSSSSVSSASSAALHMSTSQSPSAASLSSHGSSWATTPSSIATSSSSIKRKPDGQPISPAAVKRSPSSPAAPGLPSLRDTFNAGRSGNKRARVDTADNSSSSSSVSDSQAGEWTLTPSSYFWSELQELAQADPFFDLLLLAPTTDVSRKSDLVVLFGGLPLERVRTASELRVGTYRVAAKQVTMRIAIEQVKKLVYDNDAKNAPDAAPMDHLSSTPPWCQISITVGSPSDAFVSWTGFLTIKTTDSLSSMFGSSLPGSSFDGPSGGNGGAGGFGPGSGFGGPFNGAPPPPPPPSNGGNNGGSSSSGGNYWLGFPSMSHFGVGPNLSLPALNTLHATLAHYFAGDFDLRTGGRTRLSTTRASRARHFFRAVGLHQRGGRTGRSSATTAAPSTVTPSTSTAVAASRQLFIGGEIAGREETLEGALANIICEVYRFYSLHYSHDSDYVEAVLSLLDIASELGRTGESLFRHIVHREMGYHSSGARFRFVFARRNGTMDARTFTVTPDGTIFAATKGIATSQTGVRSLDLRAFIEPLPAVHRIPVPVVATETAAAAVPVVAAQPGAPVTPTVAAPSTPPVVNVAAATPAPTQQQGPPAPIAAALSETDLLTKGLDVNSIRGRIVAQWGHGGYQSINDRSPDATITLARTLLNEVIGECTTDEKKRLVAVTDYTAQTLSWLTGKPSMMSRVVLDASRELSDSKFLENTRGDMKTDQFAAIGLDYACYVWWKEFGDRVSINEEEYVRAVAAFMRSDIYVALGIQYTRNMTRARLRQLYHLFTAAPGNAQLLTLRHFVLSFLTILTPISPIFINNQAAGQASCPNDMAAVADMLYHEVATKPEWRSRFYGNLSRDAARIALNTIKDGFLFRLGEPRVEVVDGRYRVYGLNLVLTHVTGVAAAPVGHRFMVMDDKNGRALFYSNALSQFFPALGEWVVKEVHHAVPLPAGYDHYTKVNNSIATQSSSSGASSPTGTGTEPPRYLYPGDPRLHLTISGSSSSSPVVVDRQLSPPPHTVITAHHTVSMTPITTAPVTAANIDHLFAMRYADPSLIKQPTTGSSSSPQHQQQPANQTFLPAR